jgi:hypothetical protein
MPIQCVVLTTSPDPWQSGQMMRSATCFVVSIVLSASIEHGYCLAVLRRRTRWRIEPRSTVRSIVSEGNSSAASHLRASATAQILDSVGLEHPRSISTMASVDTQD